MKISNKIVVMSWLGTILSISAYILNIFGYIKSTGIIYAGINVLAALLLSFRLFKNKNMSQLILNTFFGIISIIAVVIYLYKIYN